MPLLRSSLHDVLVGRGRADHGVDDEQHDVAQVDRDLGLRGDGGVDAARVGLPPAGVDDGEAAVHPLGLVGDAVARDTRGVFDDRLAATEDAVHERGLADVRPAHDRDDRQRRGVLDAVVAERDARQQLGVLIVELVVGEARAQGFGALLRRAPRRGRRGLRRSGRRRPRIRRQRRLICALLSVWVRPCGRRRGRHPRSVRNRDPTNRRPSTPGAAVRKSTTVESWASRRCSASATHRASCPVSSALRRAARTAGAAVSRIRTGASGATTVVMSRPSTTTPGRSDSATSVRKSAFTVWRTAGTRATPLTASVTRGSRIACGDVGAADPHPVVVGVERDRVVEIADDVEDGCRIRRVGAVVERVPGQRAVGGAGVEEAEAQSPARPASRRSTCRCRRGRRSRRRSRRRSAPGSC